MYHYGAPASLEAYYQQVGCPLHSRRLPPLLCTCCAIACCYACLVASRHCLQLTYASGVGAAVVQAGRAGRDGVPSSCILLWSAADASKNAIIKVQRRAALLLLKRGQGPGCACRLPMLCR